MSINALKFGMSYEQFWHNDLSAYFIYMKSYEQKRIEIINDFDILAWRIGSYIINSIHNSPIAVTLPMSKTDIKKCSIDYPTEPLSLKKENTQKQKPRRKIQTTPPTADEIAEYNRKMLLLRQQ